jgi:hypothetical protein
MRVEIKTLGLDEPVVCQGETIIVNRHGALISTTVALRVGLKVEVHVLPTGKRGLADVVYVDPDRPRVCGVGLASPENIWGLSFPPEDWREGTHL